MTFQGDGVVGVPGPPVGIQTVPVYVQTDEWINDSVMFQKKKNVVIASVQQKL